MKGKALRVPQSHCAAGEWAQSQQPAYAQGTFQNAADTLLHDKEQDDNARSRRKKPQQHPLRPPHL